MPPEPQTNGNKNSSYALLVDTGFEDDDAIFDRENDLDLLQAITLALTSLGTSSPELRKKAEQLIHGIGAGMRTKKYVVSYLLTMLRPYTKS